MLENFMDVPDTAVLGSAAYADFLNEMHNKTRYVSPPSFGITVYTLYTAAGVLRVVENPIMSPDHISIGKIELQSLALWDTCWKLLRPDRDLFNPYFGM